MIRQIIKPKSNDAHIAIPDEYVGKTLEILAFTIDEHKKGTADDHLDLINSLYDGIRVDFSDFVFNRDEANSR